MKVTGCVTACLLAAGPAFAGGHRGWTSLDEESSVAFGSIKKNTVGEVHHLSSINGTVGENIEVAIEIALTSVET